MVIWIAEVLSATSGAYSVASSPTTDLDRFCGFAERFLTDEASRPLVIERWQREILGDYFAGSRELVVLVSKKNGKTSLFAGLALWHVITVAFADVAILAASATRQASSSNSSPATSSGARSSASSFG